MAKKHAPKSADTRAEIHRLRMVKLFSLLKEKPLTVLGIYDRMKVNDPRNEIRNLRSYGVKVCDRYIKSPELPSTQYKEYWIEEGTALPDILKGAAPTPGVCFVVSEYSNG